MGKLGWGLILLCLGWLLMAPAVALETLTPTMLGDRLTQTEIREGKEWVDLTHVVIDLTTEEGRSQFFTPLAPKVKRNPQPVVLDLSDSVIYGDWRVADLATRVKFAPAALAGLLTPNQQAALFPDPETPPAEFQTLPYVQLVQVGLRFNHTVFHGPVEFQGGIFLWPVMAQGAEFLQGGNWSGSRWQAGGDFSQTHWSDRALWMKSFFPQGLDCADATFNKGVSFRGSHFAAPLNFQDVKLLETLNLSNIEFTPGMGVNVDGLVLDAEAARLVGDRAHIGSLLHLEKLRGNEALLLQLIRSFRRGEQIPDANQLEVLRSRLRIEQLFTEIRTEPWYRRPVQIAPLCRALGLSLLLLLTDYGTDAGLVLTLGLLSGASFALMIWFVDRVRRRLPIPLLPHRGETLAMGGSFTLLAAMGLGLLWQRAEQPGWTLLCLSLLLIPVPLALILPLYFRGRYHAALDQTYLVEDGSMRQLRLLIVRLPIIPKFPFFRDRYTPIVGDRRWSWLNYYDFSLNNLFKFGFNDIRLRDEHLPGWVAALVWYQWALGLFYIALLLWTLSRTIPGLNLFLYLS
ncbi:MAG: pentapeptide repeat-containing protein [Spirulina sp. DLM2.Bin59]|nr:MAG: pentapeptide repeat-containing protein [Spirulina sp. DLM2.Bin59]